MPTPHTITGTEIGLLSYLFEAVGDLLTEEQRQELSNQLTSLRPAGVAPGDLITADLFNGMLNNVNDLLARVAVLEGEGSEVRAPIIISLNKSVFTVGDEMRVTGRNLDPVKLTRIFVGSSGVPLDRLKTGSNDSLLIFDTPSDASLPDVGGMTILTVENSAGFASQQFELRPLVLNNLTANITPSFATEAPVTGTPATNDFTLTFNLTGRTSRDEQWIVEPVLDNPLNHPGWSVAMAPGNALITIPECLPPKPALSRTVTVNLTKGTIGPVGVSLLVRSQNFPAHQFPSTQTQISPTSPTPAARTDITLTGLTRVAAASGGFLASLDDGITIHNALSAQRQVDARIAIEDLRNLDGVYTISQANVPNTAAWTVSVNAPVTINASSTVHSAQVRLNIQYNRAGQPDFANDATVISVSVVGAGALPDRVIEIPLKAAVVL
jgi:hypothetical protein